MMRDAAIAAEVVAHDGADCELRFTVRGHGANTHTFSVTLDPEDAEILGLSLALDGAQRKRRNRRLKAEGVLAVIRGRG